MPPGVRGCAIIPQVGAMDEWFVDTGQFLPGLDPHVLVSKTGCLELGKEAGMLHPDDAERLRGELDDARTAIADLQAEVDSQRAVIDAVDVIESADFRARKRAGRKPKTKPEKVAA